jgi:hypothetical protein
MRQLDRWKVVGAMAFFGLFVADIGSAGLIPGGGKPSTDCLVEWDVQGASGSNRVSCMDGDPTCDTDGQCQNTCTFSIRLCVNQSNVAGCTPSAFKKPPKVKMSKVPVPSTTGAEAACGDFVDVAVPLKHRHGRNKFIAGRMRLQATAKGSSGPADKDMVFLTCMPRSGTCPPQVTTTTTIAGGTTTTTVPGQGQAPVPLGSAANFVVLAGSTVTNTGATTVTGDLGVSPGTAVTGFPPGMVTGATHAGDATAAQAQIDLTTAFNDAAGRSVGAVTVAGNLGGQTLTPGLYKSTSSLAISSGDLTLDAQGSANAVFIFQMASTLTTTAGRQVILSGGAKAANVSTRGR